MPHGNHERAAAQRTDGELSLSLWFRDCSVGAASSREQSGLEGPPTVAMGPSRPAHDRLLPALEFLRGAEAGSGLGKFGLGTGDIGFFRCALQRLFRILLGGQRSSLVQLIAA